MHIALFSGALQKKNRPLAHIAGIQNAKKLSPLRRISPARLHESLYPLISRARSAPSHRLDGRETAIPPAEPARSAKRRSCGMQFAGRTRTARPRARAWRAARRRCADPYALRRQASKYHSKAAGVSMASGREEVCGHACLHTIKKSAGSFGRPHFSISDFLYHSRQCFSKKHVTETSPFHAGRRPQGHPTQASMKATKFCTISSASAGSAPLMPK